MEKLHSHWLINRLKKSERSPTEQLLHFFEVMEEMPDLITTDNREELLEYLSALAIASKINDPEFFAHQIFFMAAEAREQQLNHPESQALIHAKTAAKALVTAQTQSRLKQNSPLYAMAASFFLIFGLSSMMFNQELIPIQSEEQLSSLLEADFQPSFNRNNNPKRISEMLSNREKMRQGTCRFPEALMLDEADRSIYLKTVVYGEVSQDIKEQEVTARLMQTVRCDYTPMLMKNSIS